MANPLIKLFRSKIRQAIFLLILVLILGVVGYKDPNGEYLVNSEADLELAANSKVIVLGRPEQIQHLNSLYDID